MSRLLPMLCAAALTACSPTAPLAPEPTQATAARVHPGDVQISTQADVTAFQDVTEITGRLLVTGDEVTDLDLPLLQHAGAVEVTSASTLHTVDLGSLEQALTVRLQTVPLLQTLALPQLTRAGGVVIEDVAALTQVGLPRWQGPGGGLYLRDAPQLRALDVSALRALQEGLVLQRVGLTTVHAPQLRSLGDRLELTDLDALVDASFPALQEAGAVDISDLAALQRLDLGAFTRTEHWFVLTNLPSLVEVRLDRLAAVGDGVDIHRIGAAAGLSFPALATAARINVTTTGEVPWIRLPALRTAGQLHLHVAPGADAVGAVVGLPRLIAAKFLTLSGEVSAVHAPLLRGARCLRMTLQGDATPLSLPALEQAHDVNVDLRATTGPRDLLLPRLRRFSRVDLRGDNHATSGFEGLGQVDLSSLGTHGDLSPEVDAGYPHVRDLYPRNGCDARYWARTFWRPVYVKGAERVMIGALDVDGAELVATQVDVTVPASGEVTVQAEQTRVRGDSTAGTLRIVGGEVDARALRSVAELQLVLPGPFHAPALHTIHDSLVVSQADEVDLPALIGHDDLEILLGKVRRVHLPALTVADNLRLWDEEEQQRLWYASLDGVQITGDIELDVPSLARLRVLSVRDQPRLRALELPTLTGRVETIEVLLTSDLERLHLPLLEDVGLLQLQTTPSDPAVIPALDLDLTALSTLDHAWLEGTHTLGTLSLPSLLGPADDLVVRASSGVSRIELPELQHAGRLYLEGINPELIAPALRTVQTLELGAALEVFNQALTPPAPTAAPLSLPLLHDAGWLRITHHGGISRLRLPALTRLTERLVVQDLPRLTDVELDTLQEATGGAWMNFIDLPSLTVARLPQATHLGRLAFVRTGIEEIDLPAVEVFDDHLTAYDNPDLVRVAYRNVRSALEVYLDANPRLTSVELPSLTSTEAVTVWDHAALTTLDLGALQSVAGELWIADNPALNELRLPSQGLAGAWTVTGNTGLDACELDAVAQGWQIGTYTVQDNGTCAP